MQLDTFAIAVCGAAQNKKDPAWDVKINVHAVSFAEMMEMMRRGNACVKHHNPPGTIYLVAEMMICGVTLSLFSVALTADEVSIYDLNALRYGIN